MTGTPENEPFWDSATKLDDLPEVLRAEIHHFFDVYKTLEPDKKSTTTGYDGLEAALDEIEAARKRGG